MSRTPLFTLLSLALLAPSAARAAQPGESRAAADDDAEPGGTTSAAIVATTDAEGDTTVVAAAVVRDPVEHGRIAGRHRLHIDADVLSWRRWRSWDEESAMDPDGPARFDSVGLVGGVPLFGAPGGVGPTGNFALGYGYGVTDSVIVGARLGLGFQHNSTPEDDGAASGVFAYTLTPYFEYVFRPRTRVRPFLGARIGLGGSVLADRAGEVTQRVSTIGPTFGAGTGVHAFLTERVSLDAALWFDYALAFSRARTETPTPPPMGDDATRWQRASLMPNLALVVGLSVWLGRDRAPVPRRDRDNGGNDGD